MVKKLIKYDFASYLRLLLPAQIILLAVAAACRIIEIFENYDSAAYPIFFGMSISLYVMGCVALLVLTFVVALVRFYQGMYTREGYLNHTLPVTPTQHIVSKLLTSMLFLIGTSITIVISFCIVTLGDLNIELFKSFFFLIGRGFKECGGNMALFIIEFVLLLIVTAAANVLKIYFCVSVGQLVSRKKILLAFGVYAGIYAVTQTLNSILLIIISVNEGGVFNFIGSWASSDPVSFFHFLFIGVTVFYVIVGIVYFIFTRRIMSKKLNLT